MDDKLTQAYVAPRAGAWIETSHNNQLLEPIQSRPARARGLKHNYVCLEFRPWVAPRAGAWIETRNMSNESILAQGRAPRGRVD